MLKPTSSALAALTPMFASLKSRFGLVRPQQRSDRAPLRPELAPRARVDATEDYLSIPVLDQSPDDRACREAHLRGQFLARQDRWDELASEVTIADKTRAVTPGGMPVADLLAFGARSDVIHGVEHALMEGRTAGEAPLINGIIALETVQRDYASEPVITLIVALAHIDVGWAWRGTGWETIVPELCRAFRPRAKPVDAPVRDRVGQPIDGSGAMFAAGRATRPAIAHRR